MSTAQFLLYLMYLGQLHYWQSRSGTTPPIANAPSGPANVPSPWPRFASSALRRIPVTAGRTVPTPNATTAIAPALNAKPLATMKPTVCIALDGFLSTARTWNRRSIGAARVGAKEFTRRLAPVADIYILTPRVNIDLDLDRPEGPQREAALKVVKDWLDENQIWYDAVCHEIPSDASLYVGPYMVATALNPVHDDFCQAEREIRTRLATPPANA